MNGMLGKLGVNLRVPSTEVAALLTSVIAGVGMHLLHDGPRIELENAYAAAWLGILSLDA
jgi:hypothetical protein